ncbi:uncharacterized protein LOC126816707 isoform X1 [Patella vulgata]|uniref:uncharacterized protein LOC126816707 isoform X1 n=1 Tax=Patella vulgata TaxID=6465 RepID=UPI00217FAFCB|nr:uncharacterized protein LOC126816707 isoform X1 [Patella vulgata]
MADNDNGCTKTPPKEVLNGPAKPEIPNTYSVHIECIIINKNQSTEIEEFFDYDGNRGTVHQRQSGIDFYAYYDYDSTEFIGVFPATNDCTVTDLSKSGERFLFGYNQGAAGGHIFTSAGALHFGANAQERYIGTDVIRGINVRAWYSCEHWDNMDATMDVYWYFSNPDSWDMAVGLPEIPIRAYVKGIAYSQDDINGSHVFEHIYDFIHFKNYISDNTIFETPSMVVCPGRKNTLDFPDLPNSFSFTIEMIDSVRQSVTFMTESYDFKSNVTKFEYKPTELTDSKYGFNPLTEIHDFNTGVAYIIDNMIGNCSMVPIEQGDFDDTTVNAHTVRMRTAKEFFSTDNTVVTYEGRKTARNLECDTWIGERSSSPSGIKSNTTWEWYFQTDAWSSVEQTDETTNPGGTPIQMRLKVPDLGMEYSYNIYGFSKATQDLKTYDISACYINGKRRRFDFQVSSSFKTNVDQNRQIFIYSTLMSLSGFMDVSPLRVANLQLSFQDDIHLRFDLLDVAPSFGDVANLKQETTLNAAADILTKAINNNEFVILLFAYNTITPITVMSGSIVEYDYDTHFSNIKSSTAKYSAGSMAGLAVGMMITGGAVGAGVAFKLFK